MEDLYQSKHYIFRAHILMPHRQWFHTLNFHYYIQKYCKTFLSIINDFH